MSSAPADQAAAVCYRWKHGQLELLLILTSGRRRIFPKGNIDPGETPWQAAQREAREEAGAAGAISEDALTVFRHRKRGGEERRVAAYLLRVENTGAPHESRRDPQWYTPEGAIAALAAQRDPESAGELQRVVREACASIGTPLPSSARASRARER